MSEKGLVELQAGSDGHDRVVLTRKGEETHGQLIRWMDEFIHMRDLWAPSRRQKPIYTTNPFGALMAEGEGAGFARKVTLGFFTLLLVAGIAVYWIWGVLYGTWNPLEQGNMGIYTIYVPLIGFGILGILLYRRTPQTA